MRKLFYSFAALLLFSVVGLSSCASSKGGGWYKNRNNTYVPEKPQNLVKFDKSEEFVSEAEMVVGGYK